jgi:glycosyltransferase involved in cell wall biosynthesis
MLPSTSESFSNSLMEAMASGCCAIASRVGGNVELIEDGQNGLLFDPGRADQLGSCLVRAARDPDLRRRLAERGSQTIHRSFSTGAAVRRMEDLYAGLLAGKRPDQIQPRAL